MGIDSLDGAGKAGRNNPLIYKREIERDFGPFRRKPESNREKFSQIWIIIEANLYENGEEMRKDSIIKQYVDEMENEEGKNEQKNELVYRDFICIYRMNLDKIGKEQVDKLHDCLKWWGIIRVIGQDKNWSKSLHKEIMNKKDTLEKFRREKLENALIGYYKEAIKEHYESFKNCFQSSKNNNVKQIDNRVGAAKILHMLCPNFFPPWDNDIAAAYRLVVRKDKTVKPFSSEDYFRFMEYIRDFIISNSETVSELAKDYKINKIRIVDECLFCAVHRHAPTVFYLSNKSP